MKKFLNLLFIFIITLTLSACKTKTETQTDTTDLIEPKWLEDETGVYYQVFVRSFADSNGDGIGDLNGLTNKLDYLQDLGVEGIWLMPIHPTDSYHGYDVKDYYAVNPEYGTMEDFDKLIEEAHKREIKIILDLVVNHTSKNHPWFISSSQSEESEYRDYYTWAAPTESRVTKLGSDGQTIWYRLGDMYYASYFSDTMPDLNYTNEEVHDEVINIGEYWINKGVNGFRLDAAKHLYGVNEVPKQYNYLNNIYFWDEFRTALQKIDPNVYLVGEVMDNAAVYSLYYGGLDSNFNFDASNLILDSVNNGNGSYANRLNQIYIQIGREEEDFRDSPFLRNHDQNRTASILHGDIEKIKLAAEMLLTLPGNPYIYYGEEIGMFGVKTDGNVTGTGVWDETRRLPFVWGDEQVTPDWMDNKCSQLLTSCNQPINPLNIQINDENSLFNTYKEMIKLRSENSALDLGKFAPFISSTNYVQGFFRYDDQQLLVVIHNLSNVERDMPVFTNAELIYQSKGSYSYNSSRIDATSTIILELPYEKLNEFILN
ncbi:MAG: hypothetical protein K0Q49_736 [Haloplasmataceae bacterium]|nr:hypothetical protein [Haloplasmataceae bacterium]